MLVKKQFNCISCDKNLKKFQGKIGQHLNWDSMAARKLSPGKVTGFGTNAPLSMKVNKIIENNALDS